ncbi:MAG: nuclear transport factor 2 family protein [candidate division Zixibacteria bacterium]|nr:nuclear transport factor 2 family protein [candidate division Zixibacteria bacterium]
MSTYKLATAAIVLSLIAILLSFGCEMAEQEPSRNNDETEKAIRQLESRRFQAMIEADTAALDTILADDLTYTHTNGWVDTKEQFIGWLETGELNYESITTHSVLVRVYAAVAVVTGQAAVKIKVNGQEKNLQIRFIDVYVKRNAHWQMVAWQSIRLQQ